MAYYRPPILDVVKAQQSATLARCFRLQTTALAVNEEWNWTTCSERVRLYSSNGSSVDYRSGAILEVGNMRHVAGLRDSDFMLRVAIGDDDRLITREEVRSGMLRDAVLGEVLIDWLNPHHPPLRRTLWYVGDYHEDADTLRLDLKGVSSRFKASMGWPLQTTCVHQFGDAGCDFGGSISASTHWGFRNYRVGAGSTRGKIVMREGGNVFTTEAKAIAGWWAHGDLVMQSGASEGERATIRSNTVPAVVGSYWTTILTLSSPLLVPPVEGDYIDARVGCSRYKLACHEKFGNTDNFEGYDAIPGTDIQTATPGLR